MNEKARLSRTDTLLTRLESSEKAFLKTRFLAPVLPGGRVRVQIAGLVHMLRVKGEFKPGWAILKPLGMEEARVVGKPGPSKIAEYLALFPMVRLLLLARAKNAWLAVAANRGDKRVRIEGAVPVQFAAVVEPFQQIVTRFDGTYFWFQEVDRRRNPVIASYLREALAAGIKPEDLHKPTLTAEERGAYQVLFTSIETARRSGVELRLKNALDHAGAELSSYIERDDSYTLTYLVDGETHRSAVRKEDLTVIASGICLSGQDQRFDLQSLIGVIREGMLRQSIVQVGEGDALDEEID